MCMSSNDSCSSVMFGDKREQLRSCDVHTNYGNTLTNISTCCRRRSPQKITKSPVL